MKLISVTSFTFKIIIRITKLNITAQKYEFIIILIRNVKTLLQFWKKNIKKPKQNFEIRYCEKKI